MSLSRPQIGTAGAHNITFSDRFITRRIGHRRAEGQIRDQSCLDQAGGKGGFLVAVLAVVLVIIAPDMLPAEDRAAVAAACDGRAVAGSGSYTGGMEGLMSFAKADASSAYTFEQNSSTSLKPASTVGDVTSVLCLDAPTQTIDDVCAYGDEGDDIEDVVLLESVSVSRTARLVDPSTGQDVATHSVTNPGDECPELVFESTSEKRFWGSEPDVDSFEEWLVQQLGS